MARGNVGKGRPSGPVPIARGIADPRRVQVSVRLQRGVAVAALPWVIALAADDAWAAGAQLGVSVTVPLVAAMQTHYQAPALTITAADVERGYVDVQAGTRFSVASTSRDGYVIDFVPKAPLFEAVEVVFANERAQLGRDGGTVIARGRPRRDTNGELSYRFRIGMDVAPGVYPFPLILMVRPL